MSRKVSMLKGAAAAVAVLAVISLSPGWVAAQDKAQGKPATENQAKLKAEWKQVKEKYPLVASSHLDAVEQLMAATVLAKSGDQKAFAQSQFASLLLRACEEGSTIVAAKWLCEAKSAPVISPGSACRSCSGVCAMNLRGGVDCTACREERANRGCL